MISELRAGYLGSYYITCFFNINFLVKDIRPTNMSPLIFQQPIVGNLEFNLRFV